MAFALNRTITGKQRAQGKHYTYLHTCIHTYIHAHIHTYMHAYCFYVNHTDLANNDTLNMLAAKAGGYDPGNFTFRLEHFTYANSVVNEVIRDYMIETDFDGVTV